MLEAAEKEPPPAPGALPAFLSGSRMRKGSDIALLQYTSGSTGNPKGVVLTHANLLANMRALAQAVQLGPGDVAVSWLPLYHDMGLIGAWLTLLLHGLPLVVMSPLAFLTRPERWLQAFSKHRGTIAAAPNFAYELCVRKASEKALEGIDLSSWRAALNGAEPVNPETLERFVQRFGKYGFRRESLLPVYGLAEASLGVTVPPLDRGPLVDCVQRDAFTMQGRAVPASSDGERSISFVSSGKPLAGHDVLIVDAEGNELADRTEGFSVVPRTFGDERLLQECGSHGQALSARSVVHAGRVSVAEFRRPRLSRGWRNLCHRPREGHHHQRWAESLPARSGRAGVATSRESAKAAWWRSD